MKKISILCVLAMTGAVSASPYIGLQTSGYFLKNKVAFKGKYTDSSMILKDFNVDQNMDMNVFRFGLLGGWSFKIQDKLHLNLEGDIDYSNKKKTIQFDDEKLLNAASHLNDYVTVKAGLGFGFMPMVRYEIKDKLSGLLGLRFAAKHYEVTAYHAQGTGTTIDDGNSKTEKKFLFSVEPTIGAQYDFSDRVSGRFMVGYNFGSRKTYIDNYLKSTTQVAFGNTTAVSIDPKGMVVRAAVTYSF